MRVLLYTDSNQFAGTERHILDLACGIRDECVDVRIACPGNTPLANRAVDLGLLHVAIEKQGLVDRRAAWNLRRLLLEGEVDIIHAHNGRTALAASFAVSFARRGKCVASQHFLEPNRLRRQGVKRIVSDVSHNWVNRKISRFIAISEAALNGMIERGDGGYDTAQVIQNGIAEPNTSTLKSPTVLRKELGISENAPLIGCLSRLEREKDVTSLISAMAGVIESQPDARCVIAGDGSLRKDLNGQTKELGLENAVLFLGHVNDALSIVNACDLFVLPSAVESFGLAIVEAMALGKPVIATDAGGPKEIVVHGKTGLLVPPSDPNALATAILELLSNPELARQMGAAGRERYLDRYTAERMAKETLEVYREVLGEAAERKKPAQDRAMARRTL